MRTSLIGTALGLALLGLVTGCVRLPDSAPAPERYLLSPAPPESSGAETGLSNTVTVAVPEMAPPLRGDAIAVVRDGRRLDHFAGARWAAPLGEMLHDFWREALERHHGVTDWAEGGATYRLETVVRDLQAEYGEGQGPPRLRVTVVAGLRERSSGELVASRRFSATRRAETDRLDSVVTGLEGLLRRARTKLLPPLLEGRLGN